MTVETFFHNNHESSVGTALCPNEVSHTLGPLHHSGVPGLPTPLTANTHCKAADRTLVQRWATQGVPGLTTAGIRAMNQHTEDFSFSLPTPPNHPTFEIKI